MGRLRLKSGQFNRRSRRVPIFWTRAGNARLSQRREIRDYIETRADAAHYREVNLRALGSEPSLRAIAIAIRDCRDEAPCGRILCPLCGRQYRLWLASEIVSLASPGLPAFVVTILLTAALGSDLRQVDVRQLHECARKRLVRCGVRAAIGGTEASYDAAADRWVVHLHLLVFDAMERARPLLRRSFDHPELDRPVVCKRLRNPVAQITYLQKFLTCHRPGQPGFSGRGRAYPMKTAQIIQLATWSSGRRFEDFLFILGLRRRGERLVAERGFAELRREHLHRATRRRGDASKLAPRNNSGALHPRLTNPAHRRSGNEGT
jgi:hypothetical protein